ncbi:MAG TPA: rod shape-determining protein MreC [Chroococcidiopsis sp.]
MFTVRRWWDKYGLRIGLVSLALGTAWTLRVTQGAPVIEVYRWVVSPFQGAASSQRDILENAQVEELQNRLTELEAENRELRRLLDYSAASPQKGLITPVIGRSADHWWQQITLGRGSRDGIKVGDVVSGTGGIVGRVVQVTPNTSRVLLISDPSSQVGVTISRSRYMGSLRGQAQNRAILEFFDKVPDVRPGDVVSTSDYSQLYPAGLPIGRVESVNLNKTPAPEAIIELTAPISYLEWVVVSSGTALPREENGGQSDNPPSRNRTNSPTDESGSNSGNP